MKMKMNTGSDDRLFTGGDGAHEGGKKHSKANLKAVLCAGLGWAVMCVMAPVASRGVFGPFPFGCQLPLQYGNAIKAMRSASPFPSKGVVFVAFSSRSFVSYLVS